MATTQIQFLQKQRKDIENEAETFLFASRTAQECLENGKPVTLFVFNRDTKSEYDDYDISEYIVTSVSPLDRGRILSVMAKREEHEFQNVRFNIDCMSMDPRVFVEWSKEEVVFTLVHFNIFRENLIDWSEGVE